MVQIQPLKVLRSKISQRLTKRKLEDDQSVLKNDGYMGVHSEFFLLLLTLHIICMYYFFVMIMINESVFT